MATINYENKEALNVNPTIPNKNKVVDSDMNLIKQVGNQILTTMGVYTDTWSSSATYNVDEIAIYDNRIFKNLTGTNAATTPDEDTTNWEETTLASMSGGGGGGITGDTLPIGSIMPYGSATAPTNWLVCDGSAVSRTTYAELFSAIGTSFGSGDGSTTFNLPNLKGKVPVGQNTSDGDFDNIGETGGSKQHQHLIPLGFDNGGYLYGYADNDGNPAYGSDVVYNIKRASLTGFTQTDNQPARIGATAPDSSVQPYQVVCYIIKAKQSSGLVANVSNTQSDSTIDTYSCDYINGAIDGVVEQGRNANGDYIKFANGMLICSSYFGPVETQGGQGAQRIVNFPREFVNDQYSCNISIITGQSYWADIAYCVNGKTKYGFTLQTWNRGGNTNTGQWFNYIAIGRWK